MGYVKMKGPTFPLNPQLKYMVYVHDPTFFVQAYQLLPTPGLMFSLDEGLLVESRFISVTKHREKNEKTSPCNEDPKYDFQFCVRNSLARQVGCRAPWDFGSFSNFRVCWDIDQIKMLEDLYMDISIFSDLE